jgi:hypothetical protein
VVRVDDVVVDVADETGEDNADGDVDSVVDTA